MIRRTYSISGTVQGVGFRPTLYRLARKARLGGWIQNRSGTVLLTLEGLPTSIDTFISELPSKLPTHATITDLQKTDEETLIAEAYPTPFYIRESGFDDKRSISIPADLAMCTDCRQEISDPHNRRYRYPFTTCTNCGPRYTVVHGMPYDRSRTTLNAFPLCDACQAEYHDPTNRRFHAESMACPDCGPTVSFEPTSSLPPIAAARKRLAEGGILAIRGIGGYHLAADATNAEALTALRQRKHRPAKPFAVMARDLEAVRRVCHLSDEAAALLEAPEAPIVILDLLPRPTAHVPLSTAHISPDTQTLGVMLPTSPLHHLLFEQPEGDTTTSLEFLVMTSGNKASEPICITNDEARARLNSIADALLLHNREINLRNDDSLVAQQMHGMQLWRRARGYAPSPIKFNRNLPRSVLAMGAELKNGIAFAVDQSVTLSPHIGDLSTPEARDAHERVSKELPHFLGGRPACIAVDLHPDMYCTRHGERLARELRIPIVRVQHHHAHAASCLAENGKDSGMALVFDGTGLGTDGNIWGAELLYVERNRFTRLATFAATPLPGGDMAAEQPIRQLVARWHAAGISPSPELLSRCGITQEQHTVWTQQCSQNINAPLTHSAGRLFDAFSALLGYAPTKTTYEGQAPIRLETAARHGRELPPLPYDRIKHGDMLSIDWSPAFRELSNRHAEVWQNDDTARQVHDTIANAAIDMVAYGAEQTSEKTIALSGGVFMNGLLCSLLIPKLDALGIKTLTHCEVPPNDGGIALGQSLIAAYEAE